MSAFMIVLLIGLRGSGKTTIGRTLAERLSLSFADLDDLTVKALGATTVSEAWRTHGEAAFRRAEATALKIRITTDSQVLALGGGTPTAPGAGDVIRAAQKQGARVVYLR